MFESCSVTSDLTPPLPLWERGLGVRGSYCLAQVCFAHAVVCQELGSRARRDDVAGFHHVAAVGVLQGESGVLLDEQDGHTLIMQLLDDSENIAHDERREAQARLVEQE